MSTSQNPDALPRPARTSRPPRGRRSLLTTVLAAFAVVTLACTVLSACTGNKDATTTAGSSGTTTSSSSASTSGKLACGQPTAHPHIATAEAVGFYGSGATILAKFVFKPAKSGAFAKTAPNRKSAIIKAGGAALVAVYFIKKGNSAAAKSPTLCRLLPGLNKATESLGKAEADMKAGGGNLGTDLSQAQGSASQLQKTGASDNSPLGSIASKYGL